MELHVFIIHWLSPNFEDSFCFLLSFDYNNKTLWVCFYVSQMSVTKFHHILSTMKKVRAFSLQYVMCVLRTLIE